LPLSVLFPYLTVPLIAESPDRLDIFRSGRILLDLHSQSSYVHIYDLAQALIADIRSDLEAWAKWPGDILEDEIDERKADFGVLCDMIEKRVK